MVLDRDTFCGISNQLCNLNEAPEARIDESAENEREELLNSYDATPEIIFYIFTTTDFILSLFSLMGEVLTFKFIVLGETGVGKSCMVTRFKDDTFQELHRPTVGVSFQNVMMNVDSTEIKLQIWDTAGQEIYRSITRSYYRESKCAIIVYDVTKPETFETIPSWIDDVKKNAPEECEIVLVGNKIDLATERAISSDELRVFAEKVNFPYFETSALTGENIRSMFEECAMLVYTNENRRSRIQSMQEESQHLTEQEEGGRGKRRRCC